MGQFSCGRLFGLRLVTLVFTLSLLGFGGTGDKASAAFEIAENTFSISNAPGYCFAMAAFSRWYFLTHNDGVPLRKALNRRVQEQVAKRLQEFYSKHLISTQADYCNQHHGNQTESFSNFVGGLLMGEPRLVLLMNKGRRGPILHAVLAYEWVPEKHLIKVYDPNYCNRERSIDLERGTYSSLDITYHSICFPEILNDHPELVKKMESLYASVVVPKRTAWNVESRRAIPAAADPRLKREANSRGPTR